MLFSCVIFCRTKQSLRDSFKRGSGFAGPAYHLLRSHGICASARVSGMRENMLRRLVFRVVLLDRFAVMCRRISAGLGC